MSLWVEQSIAEVPEWRTTLAMNPIQFQAGLSLTELFTQYGTEQQCEEALEKARWPEGFGCPHCGGTAHGRFEVGSRRYWQCSRCRKQTSLRSGTIFQGSNLALRQWFQALFLPSRSKNNISALELKRQLGVAHTTAWRTKHKLMQVMAERESHRVLAGRVVLDDAYPGGERRGKAGRGSENKVPFVAAVELSEAGYPQVACFDPVTGSTKADIGRRAERPIASFTHVLSDGLNGFPAVERAGVELTRQG